MWCYIKNLFGDGTVVAVGTIWGAVATFLFPAEGLLAAAVCVLATMLLDLATKIFALSRIAGGIKKALISRSISSHAFAKGTMDKLIVFGIVAVLGGLGYCITPVKVIVTSAIQIGFALMFLRDGLSIFENLNDAGVKGIGPFKKLFKKKIEEVCGIDGSSSDENNNGGV